MSIEIDLSRIAAALEAIAGHYAAPAPVTAAPVAPAPVAPAPVAPAPVAPAPVAPAPVAPAPVAPAPVAPAPVAPATPPAQAQNENGNHSDPEKSAPGVHQGASGPITPAATPMAELGADEKIDFESLTDQKLRELAINKLREVGQKIGPVALKDFIVELTGGRTNLGIATADRETLVNYLTGFAAKGC